MVNEGIVAFDQLIGGSYDYMGHPEQVGWENYELMELRLSHLIIIAAETSSLYMQCQTVRSRIY
jgi:hypothetical protein